MIIDAYQHFWYYNPVEYGWIGEDMKNIRCNFLPADLKNEINNTGINGVISVQARQTIEETDWLLQLTKENDFIKGVDGWLPVAKSDFKSYLDLYANNSKLCALRHVIQDEPDPEFILKKEFNIGIAQLKHFGLAFDNWPVCLVAVSYKEWLNIVKKFIAKISINEQIKILYKNPSRAYNLTHLKNNRRENFFKA